MCCIVFRGMRIEVIPDTVGQYTGLKDKDGREIYEGDIVDIKTYDKNKRLQGEIKQMSGGAYYIDHKEACMKYLHQIHCEVCDVDSPPSLLSHYDSYRLEIIGNTRELPELLTK